MKIDKIIFSSSEMFSGFWNIQSKIWKQYLGIDPVCILYGKKENTNMTEEYGKVIERDFDQSLPKVLQITWSKFDYTKTEPETTWIIGDIDMLPLQKKYFVDNISQYPDDMYLHLNFSGISLPRRGILDGFFREGSQTHAFDRNQSGDRGTGVDLPGHYHVAKGKLFTEIYELNNNELLRNIVNSHRYGMGPHSRKPILRNITSKDADDYYWCAEENYTSETLYNAFVSGKVKIQGICYDNVNGRIDRGWHWDQENKKYRFDVNRLKTQQEIVDFHCARPFSDQEDAMNEVIELSGILEI